MGLDFVVVSSDVDESPYPNEAPEPYVIRLAEQKARAGWSDPALSLGADTIVAIDGNLLGKPENQFHARTMLEQLSGRVHEVLTGVAVFDGVSCRSLCVISKVHFRAISNDEINAYWDSGEPLGKAGGYAIQGLGGIFVQRIEGSYSAIVGLPIAQTEALLVGSGLDTWGGRACLKNS